MARRLEGIVRVLNRWCDVTLKSGTAWSAFWGAHAPSRADCGALAAMDLRTARNVPFPDEACPKKVRNDEGVIASTRGRVRSPDCRDHSSPLRPIHLLHLLLVVRQTSQVRSV